MQLAHDITAPVRTPARSVDRIAAARRDLEFTAGVGQRHGFDSGATLVVVGRGRVCVRTADGVLALRGGEAGAFHGAVEVFPVRVGSGIWGMVNGTDDAWLRALQRATSELTPAALLPGFGACPPRVRRSLFRALRAGGEGNALAASLRREFLQELIDWQEPRRVQVEACPGRTLQQRRNVYARLQRVRHYMVANSSVDLDTRALAAVVSYSPWHFIRIFDAVFGETPHDFLMRRRLDEARRLLRESRLAIAEIALVAGFDNRCTFARLFRRRYGITAGDYRREHAPAAAMSARECASDAA
ncbi:helix-turn-helix transcriptional regulator [Tahibacter soli]|uniref:AraC family transcriptional regulator n=1 Tax=Tahibacter soli TaxID=2983605 RepID=A0A9X3YFX6_9GAMM|nr:AraC family transcriptional regulator [Tahibacter soli]MDC8011286.1 AraC family transcriptional regulator [Tahibacter soli]